MAAVMIDDPRLEKWTLEVIEAAADSLLVGYGGVNELMPPQRELYMRLGILGNLVKGDIVAVWKEEKGCFNFKVEGR